MKVEQKIEITRLNNGLYMIIMSDGTRIVGGAASTIIALSHAVFLEEAQGFGDQLAAQK